MTEFEKFAQLIIEADSIKRDSRLEGPLTGSSFYTVSTRDAVEMAASALEENETAKLDLAVCMLGTMNEESIKWATETLES